jgi:hypothetical protein
MGHEILVDYVDFNTFAVQRLRAAFMNVEEGCL